MNTSLIYPSKYIAAADLKGGDRVVTISSAEVEALKKLDDTTEDRLVIGLKGQTKKFVCNKTNMKTIISHHGEETEDWIGKDITLYPTVVNAFGDDHDCIRVRGNTVSDLQREQQEKLDAKL